MKLVFVQFAWPKIIETMSSNYSKKQPGHKEKTYIMSSVETLKEQANMFRAVIGKFEKTCDDVEIIIAIAKQEVSQAAEYMIAKIRQEEGTLLQSLEVTRRKRLEGIN